MLVAAAARADTIELTDLPGISVSANSFAQGGGESELIIDGRDWEDGDPYMWNAGDHGFPEDPNWVQLDFGSDYHLTRVELWGVFNPDLPFFWGYDNIFNLWTQQDGGDWVAIGSGRLLDSADGAERDATFNYSPVVEPVARYLRYEVVGGSHWSYLGEIHVQGTSVGELAGDFNHDGAVDAADYVVWRQTNGTQIGYDEWRTNFGRTGGTGTSANNSAVGVAVPEPTLCALVAAAALGLAAGSARRQRASSN